MAAGSVPLSPRHASCLEVRTSCAESDPAWDAFVEATPGGHHAQTAMWARAKTALGWKAVRVVVSRDGRTVAGAQVLYRRLFPGACIGSVPRGPVLAPGEEDLEATTMGGLHDIARTLGIRLLAVQPPEDGQTLAGRMSAWGFRPWHTGSAQPTATVVLDLAADPDDLMAAMARKTRYNIRLGIKRGVTVREGTPADLPVFCRLLVDTGARQGFSPEPEAYYRELMDAWEGHRGIRLFFAEYGGEPVSSGLLLPFGDTVYYKRGAWSGRHGQHRPNEVMQWHLISWARAEGYRRYDFEGIDPDLARLVASGQDLVGEDANSVTHFKLGFGGRMRFTPGVHVRVYHPILRAASAVFPGSGLGWLARRAAGYLKGRPAARVGRPS